MAKSRSLEFLSGLKITFSTASPQTWVLGEKLSEHTHRMTQEDIDEGLGPSFAAGRFLCHHEDDRSRKAFVRVYLQVPNVGTEYSNSTVRAKQAAPPRVHKELTALRELKKRKCDVVPDLLAYQTLKQDQEGPVPGGYITFIVWDIVPGQPLDPDAFWELPYMSRQAIREQFRTVYQKLVRCGWRPCPATPKKIIYDDQTKTMHIAGFRTPEPIDPNKEWTDTTYAKYGLVKPSLKSDWYNDPTGWTW